MLLFLQGGHGGQAWEGTSESGGAEKAVPWGAREPQTGSLGGTPALTPVLACDWQGTSAIARKEGRQRGHLGRGPRPFARSRASAAVWSDASPGPGPSAGAPRAAGGGSAWGLGACCPPRPGLVQRVLYPLGAQGPSLNWPQWGLRCHTLALHKSGIGFKAPSVQGRPQVWR